MPTEATALVVPAAPVAAMAVPTAGGARVAGYDVARGLAILGMVVVHFALVMAAPSAKDPAWLAWVLRQLDGRAAATFVVGFVALFLFVDYGRNWDWATLTYRHVWGWPGVVRNLLYDWFRSAFPWTGLLVFGMWLGRRDVRRPGVRRAMIAGGVAAW